MCGIKLGVIFFIFFCLLKASVVQPYPDSTRIFNGTLAKPFYYTYQVFISLSEGFYCGGAIVSERYVLTAAHCIEEFQSTPEIVIIKAGSTNLNKIRVITHGKQIFVHNYYNPYKGENDIGLIRVEKKFRLDKFINIITLPKKDYILKINQSVRVSGWGKSEEEEAPNKLLSVKLVVGDQKACAEIYSRNGYNVTDNHFCAHSPFTTGGACLGDSGSPVTSISTGKRKVLLGIVSGGNTEKCGNIKYPDIMVKVSKYVDWIKKIIVRKI